MIVRLAMAFALLVFAPMAIYADVAPTVAPLADVIPVPAGVSDLRTVTTPNTLIVQLQIVGGLGELRREMEKVFQEQGWNFEWLDLGSIPVLSCSGSKGARTFDFTGTNTFLDDSESCNLRIIDSSIEHCAPAPADESAAREGTRVLQEMRKRYRATTTYQDRGTEQTEFRDTRAGDFDESLTFSTAFIRPDRYRYEVVEDGEVADIAYQSGANFRGYSAVMRKDDAEEDLGMAAAGADGPVDTIGRLLGILEGDDIAETLRDVHLLTEEHVGETPCFLLEGYDAECLAVHVWVGKDDYLIRRIEENGIFTDFRTRKLITIDARANEPVSESLLGYNKPRPSISSRVGRFLEWATGR